MLLRMARPLLCPFIMIIFIIIIIFFFFIIIIIFRKGFLCAVLELTRLAWNSGFCLPLPPALSARIKGVCHQALIFFLIY